MTLGENLQKLRREAGLSQEEVAARLYLSRQSVSKWENGNAEPGVDNLKALARLYGVTVDELVGNTPEPPAGPAAKKALSPEQKCYYAAAALRTLWMLTVWTLTAFLVGFVFEAAVQLSLVFLSLDWLAVLLGLRLRRPAVWYLAVFLEIVNVGVGMGFIGLIYNSFFPGIVPVLTGSAMLVALFQRNVRTYFGILVQNGGDS